MSATQLDQQGVDGSDLNPTTAAGVADFRGFDVVLAIGLKECQGRQAFHKLRACLRTGEALQEFLKDQPGCEDLIRSEQCLS